MVHRNTLFYYQDCHVSWVLEYIAMILQNVALFFRWWYDGNGAPHAAVSSTDASWLRAAQLRPYNATTPASADDATQLPELPTGLLTGID